MHYKILQKTRDVPVSLNTKLVDKHDRSKSYSWTKTRNGVKPDLPDALLLISDYRGRLTFDYYRSDEGFIISQAFRDKLLEHAPEENYQLVPLESVDIYGKRNSDKQYSYLRFIDRPLLVDYDASEYVLIRRHLKERAKIRGYGIIGFDNLVLRDDKPSYRFFMASDTVFFQGLVVTQDLADELEQMDLVGFDVVTLEEYAIAYRVKHDPNFIHPNKLEKLRARNRKKQDPSSTDLDKIYASEQESKQLGVRVMGSQSFDFDVFARMGQQVTYRCAECQHQNSVRLELYRSGKGISELFRPKLIIKEGELVKKGAVQKNTNKSRAHLGKYIIQDVPAVYEDTNCAECGKRYMLFFGMREIQMGREVVQLSGIWEVV